MFDLFPESGSSSKNLPDPLGSSITNRVANGVTKRACSLNGAYFVEMRVYATDDIRSELPTERWKKALLSLKAQIDVETPEWESLQKCIKNLKALFEEVDVKFSAYKS